MGYGANINASTISAAGGVLTTDVDTLAELNAIVADQDLSEIATNTAALAALAGKYAQVTIVGNQTTNLTANNHVEFDTIAGGAGVTLATGAGQADGLITLAAGRVYQLVAAPCGLGSVAGWSATFQWRNNTDAVLIGKPSNTLGNANASDSSPQPLVLAQIDCTAQAKQVELRITAQTSLTTIYGSISIACIWAIQ